MAPGDNRHNDRRPAPLWHPSQSSLVYAISVDGLCDIGRCHRLRLRSSRSNQRLARQLYLRNLRHQILSAERRPNLRSPHILSIRLQQASLGIVGEISRENLIP